MAANTFNISAGLPVAKGAAQDPSGVNTMYITAGLPPAVEEAAPAGNRRRRLLLCGAA